MSTPTRCTRSQRPLHIVGFHRLMKAAAACAGALLLLNPQGARAQESGETSAESATPYNSHLGPWRAIGPFDGLATQKQRIDTDFLGGDTKLDLPDSVTTQGRTLEWQPVPRGPVNFGLLFGPAEEFRGKVAYAATTIRSDDERDVQLLIGADDGMRAWLNGQQVGESIRPAGVAEQKPYPVKLRGGENLLLVKVDNIGQDWGLAARLLPKNADIEKPLLTLRYSGEVAPGIAALPDATVELIGADGKVQGKYRVSGLRQVGQYEALYKLYAQAPQGEVAKVRVSMDLGGKPWTKEFAWADATANQQVIGEAGEYVLRGKVVDADTSSAIAGARLTFGERVTSITRSAEDGTFELNRLDPAMVRLMVSAAGHEQRIYQVAYPPKGEATIALTSGGVTLKGRITNAQGEPIPGVSISAYAGSATASDRTDKDGRYMLIGLSSGGSKSLYPTVQHPEYAPLDHFSVDLAPGGITEKDLVMERGAVARGRVTSKADGRALAGITIQQGSDRFGSNTAIPETKTDKDGNYRLAGLKTGTSYIHAFSPDWAPSMQSGSFSAGKESVFDFQLEPGKPVRGRVVDSKGKPIAGAMIVTDTWENVRMFERRATSKGNGSFELPNMPATPVETDFIKEGYASARNVKLTGGQEDVVTTLALPAKVSVRVTDAATGKPVPDFEVQKCYVWKTGSGENWENSFEKVKDAEGRYKKSYDELSNYDLKLRFRAPGYRAKELGKVIQNGAEIEGVEIELESGSAFSGKVVDASGKPVKDAKVQEYSKQQQLWLGEYARQSNGESAVTDEKGEFRFGNIPTGKFKIYASKPSEGAGFQYDLDETSTNVVIQLQPFGSVSGLMFKGDMPSTGTSLVLLQGNIGRSEDMQIHFAAKTDESGAFRISEIPAGNYALTEAVKSGNTTMYANQKPVTIQPGQDVFLAMGGEGGTRVYGRVIDEKGAPLVSAAVTIRDRGYLRSFISSTRDDGSFEIFDVPPGKFTLTVDNNSRGSDRIYFSEPVTVADTPELHHDVKVTKPAGLAKGDMLPAIEGKNEKNEAVRLAETTYTRTLLMFAASYDRESSEKLGRQLSRIAEQQAMMTQKKTGLMLLVSPYTNTKMLDEVMKETTATASRVKLSAKWMREFSRKYKMEGEMNAILAGRDGQVLAVVKNEDNLEAALKEIE